MVCDVARCYLLLSVRRCSSLLSLVAVLVCVVCCSGCGSLCAAVVHCVRVFVVGCVCLLCAEVGVFCSVFAVCCCCCLLLVGVGAGAAFCWLLLLVV